MWVLFIFILVLALTSVIAKQRFRMPSTHRRNQTSSPLPLETFTGKRILFIYAHIDDMEGSSGGMVSMISGKANISLLILTNSNKGCSNSLLCNNATTTADVTSIRQMEQLNSAAILGISPLNVHFLSYEDCLLNTYSSGALELEIVGYIRDIKPHIVFTWDPQEYYRMIPDDGWDDLGYHPDHQTSGKLALNSAWISQLNLLWPQIGPGWRIEQLYFFSFTPDKSPDYFVDVTGDPFDKKVSAFLQMKSQFEPGDEDGITDWLTLIGQRVASQVGLKDDRKAEGFVYVLF